MKELLEKIKSRGYWKVIIRPQEFLKDRIPHLHECKQVVLETKVSLRGWDFPHYDFQDGPISGTDYVEQSVNFSGQVEFWRYYQSGQFVFFKGVKEDWVKENGFLGGQTYGIEPLHTLTILNTVYLFTEIFEFASRLANKDLLGDSCQIDIVLHKAQARKLMFLDFRRELFQDYICGIQDIPYEVSTTKMELLSTSAEMALEGIIWLFQRFNWDKANSEWFREDQRKLLEKRL